RLVGAGVRREDVENQLGPVDDLAGDVLLEVRDLAWGELVVEDHGVDLRVRHAAGELGGLALADVGPRVGSLTFLDEAVDDDGAGGFGEAGQFVQRVDGAEVRARLDRPHQERPLLVHGLLGGFQSGVIIVRPRGRINRTRQAWSVGIYYLNRNGRVLYWALLFDTMDFAAFAAELRGKKGPAAVYVIAGPEALLRDRAAALLAESDPELGANLIRLASSETDWARVADEL